MIDEKKTRGYQIKLSTVKLTKDNKSCHDFMGGHYLDKNIGFREVSQKLSFGK